MSLPSPFENVDDRGLVEACTRGDEDAFAALEGRYGRVIRAIGLRVADDLMAAPANVAVSVDAYLRRNHCGPLRTWTGVRLPVFLALVAREIAVSVLTGQPHLTPTGLPAVPDDPHALDDDAEEEAFGRLPPHVRVILRLRMHGLGATGIAATLGAPRPAVLHQLGLIARRLGADHEASVEAYRIALGHASHAERVRLALRSSEDRAFRHARREAIATWEALAERELARTPPATRTCLALDGISGLADGSLRGPSRHAAEGHVGGCPHCADRLARLVMDQDVVTPLRQAARLPEPVAQLATAVSTGRIALATRLVDEAEASDPRRTRALARIAKAATAIDALARLGSSHPPWTDREPTSIPTDDEAPIVALEALALRAPVAARRAVDDLLARRVVGKRVRLLASAAQGDLREAFAIAKDVMERSSPDPELARDVDAVTALVEGEALPNEVLAERVRTLVPDVVRYVVDLGR